MSILGLGLGRSFQMALDPSMYVSGGLAADLASELSPLIEMERQARKDAEKVSYAADPKAAEALANHFGGLLGPSGVPGQDFFIVDSVPWYELLADLGLLMRCAELLEVSVGALALAIADRLLPPNMLVFFWMGRALESVPINTALQWQKEAAASERAAAADRQRTVAQKTGEDGASKRWARERAQKAWWVEEMTKARADGYVGGRPTFVEERWDSFRKRFPVGVSADGRERAVSRQTVYRDWLKGL